MHTTTASPRPRSGTRMARRKLEQFAVLVLPVLLVAWLAANTSAKLKLRGVAMGFGFLSKPARLDISESFLPFVGGVDSYAHVVAVGLCNTLFVSALAIVIASVIGTAVGLSRLSPNWLQSRCAGAFVELVRNVPLPLQLLLWYQILLNLPAPRIAAAFGGMFLTNRGLFFPTLTGPAMPWLGGFLVICGAVLFSRRTRGRSLGRGLGRAALSLLSAAGIGSMLLAAGWLRIESPALSGFNIRGGATISPELAALVLGLSIYAAAFIAEIVRASVLAVPKGQWEAGRALGLPKGRILQKIILPQAIRIGLPALSNEYLSTIKNSSLAVIIGYPELASLINTMASDTGQSIEAIAILMAAYLTISLSVGWVMHRCERRLELVVA